MMTNKFNTFHLVQKSPWPLASSVSILCLMLASLLFINRISKMMLILSTLMIMLMAFSWWRDIHRESSNQGEHPTEVMNGLKMGMVLFITSEVFFFISFFWSFFHSSFSPAIELGMVWPPLSIKSFNPMGIPLLNTILLLSSGVTVTWAHHNILKNNFNETKSALTLTIFLGSVFSMFQSFEYKEAPFSIADSSFGSTFFMATGFHGLHVLIGSIFLMVSLMRFNKMISISKHMVGFECAAWYWHFVDVVWLFLYTVMYWWGAYLY